MLKNSTLVKYKSGSRISISTLLKDLRDREFDAGVYVLAYEANGQPYERWVSSQKIIEVFEWKG